MAGKARPDSELVGLVYSVTPRQIESAVWWRRPSVLAIISGIICIALNFLFY